MDTRVFAIAIGLSLLAGFLFGLMPAWQSSGANPNRDLKEGGRVGSSSARQNRFRDAMVVAEIALSVVLLIGSGLLVRTFAGLLAVSPGLEPQGLAVSRIWIPVPNHPEANRYRSNAQRSALVREVLRQVSEVPGVREVAVGTGNSVPFLSNVRNPIAFSWSDDANDGSGNRAAEFGAVSPSYFQVLKTPLKRGRFFTGDDTERSRPIVVVNEAFARQYSSRRDLIGRQFRTSARQEWQIVGVVGDIRDDGLDLPALPHIYFSIYQRSSPDLAVFLRSRTDRGALGDAVARTVRRIDAELPVYGTRTMGELMSASMARRRFALFLMGIFAVLALFLAAIGVYGVMAYAVAQRSREYSIRIALGAQRRDILLIALRPGLVLARAGTAAGLLMAAAAARLMSTLLVGVSPADPLTFTGVPILLAAVAGVACWIPARRAARISAAQALRS
jgi:putative ABC transport system permease protein